jgi:hypothetical protein
MEDVSEGRGYSMIGRVRRRAASGGLQLTGFAPGEALGVIRNCSVSCRPCIASWFPAPHPSAATAVGVAFPGTASAGVPTMIATTADSAMSRSNLRVFIDTRVLMAPSLSS